MPIPQKITDDLAAIGTAAAKFQADNAALPGLAAAAQKADSDYASAQVLAQNDAAAITASGNTLLADLAAMEAGTLQDVPAPPPPVDSPQGGLKVKR